jgi:hypothetical protein
MTTWYYRFPNDLDTRDRRDQLIVTLSNGSTKTLPTQIIKPGP